jgi:inner membrane protease subunit 1
MSSGFRRAFHSLHLPPPTSTAIRTIQILAALHLFSTSVAELRICSGFSMLPTISHYGDCVLVSAIPYWRKRPQRGDVVVAASPMDPRHTVCKRVIGIEGDVIELDPRKDKRRWTGDDQEAQEEHRLRRLDSEGRSISRRKREGEWVRVPKGHVWLQGDNMSNSTDSRMYGPVPLAIVKGKVIARVGCGVDLADGRSTRTANGWRTPFAGWTNFDRSKRYHA